MPGTFEIRNPTSISLNSPPGGKSWGGGNNGAAAARPTDAASLLAGISSLNLANPSLYAGFISPGFNSVGSWTIRFGFGHADDVISLDGAPAISFNDLPAGIFIPSATLTVRVGTYNSGEASPGSGLFLQHGTLDESSDLGQELSNPPSDKSFAYSFLIPSHGTFLDVINDGFGIRADFVLSAGAQSFFNARITGTWDTEFFSYSLPQDGEDVIVGETITITSPGTNPVTDLDLSQLTLSWACGIITPIIQTQTLLTFLVPDSCDDAGSTDLIATGNGFQFSGPVTLGSMIILLTNGSGIYRLMTGKRQDTYYSSHRDGTTIDIKIPNPTAKTGFVGG